ncbi:fibronectin type III domain-containing protein [Gordonia westfalica]|uniref:Fibronectin type III domain-containing protein n=1 Tax=Gordonia westfalica TaxID=158898 RepID=A0ABU2GQK8_9ACTN|nr:fibronectin type III domain-containing protein [Gordonia westfalica]MDS1113160.1 fibronectin type III domain-containing protein [Gordonia westfalica]
MARPMTQPPGTPAAAREPLVRPWTIAVIVAAVLLVAVGSFFSVRALTRIDVPDAPTGLTVDAGTGRLVATWDSVPGASGYQLVRDNGVVVYRGPQTEAVDAAVPAGEHTYRVAALDGDAVSPPSPPQSVRTGATWGVYAPLVAQFPELLPQTPDTAAKWNNAECVRRYAGGRDEVGPSETGNGQVRSVFVVRCAAGAVDRPFGVFWFASKDALNAEYSRSSATSRPVRWKHGTGLIDENGRGVFKITDDPARELAMIVVLRTPAQDVLEMVDSMPI